jgi:hypothetical protein
VLIGIGVHLAKAPLQKVGILAVRRPILHPDRAAYRVRFERELLDQPPIGYERVCVRKGKPASPLAQQQLGSRRTGAANVTRVDRHGDNPLPGRQCARFVCTRIRHNHDLHSFAQQLRMLSAELDAGKAVDDHALFVIRGYNNANHVFCSLVVVSAHDANGATMSFSSADAG